MKNGCLTVRLFTHSDQTENQNALKKDERNNRQPKLWFGTRHPPSAVLIQVAYISRTGNCTFSQCSVKDEATSECHPNARPNELAKRLIQSAEILPSRLPQWLTGINATLHLVTRVLG